MEKPIETWEAMELCGLTKADFNSGTAGAKPCLSEHQIRKIRNQYWLLGISQRTLAKEYNVNHSTINNVILREGAYEDK